MRRMFFDHALLPSGWAAQVAIDSRDGEIVAVQANADAAGRERIAGIALPGMPNLHSHTFQRGMAGLAETRGPENDSFWTWRQVMYHFLGALTPEDVEAIAAFAMLEMLERGFTALAEFHYLHHDADARPYADIGELAARIGAAAAETGIGLTLLPVFYAQGNFGAAPPTEGQRRFLTDPDAFLRLLERSRAVAAGLEDAVVGIAPHSLRAVSAEALETVLRAAPESLVHIHVAEQQQEVADSLAWSGRRPVQWLLDHAPVDHRWCLIHATHMQPQETLAVARSGATIGLCPVTEANLGDGIFDGVRYLEAGGRLGIGTDSNIAISAAQELRQLEYSQRLRDRARNVLPRVAGASSGRFLYEQALAGGTAALGRRIGALAPGRRADIVVLDGDHPDLAAVSGDRWLDAYLFVTGASAVREVIAGGRDVVSNGRHHARERIIERYLRCLRRIV